MKNTKLLALVLLIIAFSIAVYSFWGICMTFFVAMIVAYLLNPLARYMTRKSKIPHALSSILVMFIFVVAFVLLISFLVPFAINQVRSLVGDLVSFAGSYDNLVNSILEYFSELGIPDAIISMAADFLSRSDSYLVSIFSSVLSGLVNMSLGIFDIIIAMIISIYFMIDGSKLARHYASQLPIAIRKRGTRIARDADLLTKKYIKSRVLISTGTSVVIYIGLTIMGIRYALLFALMSFLLDFIPYFGSILAGLVVVVYALVTGGVGLAVAVFIFVLVVNQIEGNIVAPKIEGDATGLHPIIVMFSLLACSRLFGPMGMLISTPIAAAIKLVLKEVFRFIIEPEGYDPDQTELDL